MSYQPTARRLVRFGLFELDLAAGELRKQGRKIRLQDQPFQTLEVLLSRPGELVTREELQRALWPTDTFVEFDQGLNTAIKKIRLALGDSAENPRFVETIPRKGYRFIAPVDDHPEPVNAELKQESDSGTLSAKTSTPQRQKVSFAWALASVAVIALAALAIWRWSSAQTARPVPYVVPLTSYVGAECWPTFSPDGNQVAFTWNGPKQDNDDIYVKLIGTEPPVRLTSDPAFDFSPVWSPDGRLIAFLRHLSPGKVGVFLIPSIGGQERKVSEIYVDDEELASGDAFLDWFPDSKWLAIVDKASPGQTYSLFLLSTESGGKTRLTFPPQEYDDESPAISPDGRALVFTRFLDHQITDLFLVELSQNRTPKGEPRRLTFENRYSVSPVWTPDGRAIVFSSGPLHTPSLWEIVLSRRAAKPERLAFAGEGSRWPAISRRGQLAYAQTAHHVDVWRLELNGGRPAEKPATDLISSTRIDHTPRYSPDGKRIVFASNRSGSFEIWVCNRDGSNAVQLTSLAIPNDVGVPVWSPDGHLIYFSAPNQDGKIASYVISSEGGRPRPSDHYPDGWSRDGKWMYFRSRRSGEEQIWKMSVNGGDAIQVTKKGGIVPMESPDGRYLYYLKGMSETRSSVWRLPLPGGEEAQVLESVFHEDYAVGEEGIYFIPDVYPFSVKFLSFDTGRVLTIAGIPRRPAWGFSASPDGRWLLYTRWESNSDLMLVGNFR